MVKKRRKTNDDPDRMTQTQAKRIATDLGLSAYRKLNGYWAVE